MNNNKCSEGHSAVWSSSSLLGEKHGQKLYACIVCFAGFFSSYIRKQFLKRLLAKRLNLHYAYSATQIQSLHALPSIRELWDKMKEVIWKVFENDVLVVCGDGRMDFPGFSTKYHVYTMMEHYLNVIVDLEVVDKREAGGTSTLMEKIGCKRLLGRMMNNLNLGELVTDASKVIMEFKGTCMILQEMF